MRRAALLLAVASLAAGCGQTHAHQVLSDTAKNLGKIHSGELTLRLVVSPRQGTKGRIGFISTGTRAYAEVNGKVYELPASAAETVRRAAGGIGGSGGVGGLDIASWVKHPHVTSTGGLDHVSADLDVVNAANGLLGLLRGLGRDTPTIQGDEAKKLSGAVDSSSFDVWSGRQDHLLRRLSMKADLGLNVPVALQRVLGSVVGAKIEFELAVAHPNQAVSVPPPANPLPSSQLP